MSANRVLFLILALFLSRIAGATTHVVIFDGHSIYIGSDGLTRIDFYPPLHTCKLLTKQGMVFLDWGDTALYPPDVDPKKAVPIFDYKKSAVQILSKNLSPEETYKELTLEAEKELRERVARGTNSLRYIPYTQDQVESLHIGGLMIWMQGDRPQFREFDSHFLRQQFHAFGTQRYVVPDIEVDKPYQFPTDFTKAFGHVAAVHDNVTFAHQHPVQLIEEILEATTKIPSQQGKVGKPYALARLSPEGLVWECGSDLCDSSQKTSSCSPRASSSSLVSNTTKK